MGDAESGTREARELIARCLAGEFDAINQFQETYGPLIYAYPMRVYRMPAEDAGDFYVFVFDNGRIFRRMQSYAGRTALRSYLAGFVLDHLVLEWKRGMRSIETVPIDSLHELAAPDGAGASRPTASLNEILAPLDPSRVVLLKLLFIEDCDLQADELRHLSAISGRPLPELLTAIDGLRERVRDRESRQKHIEDALDGVQAWIALYERRLRQIADALTQVAPGNPKSARLSDERAELERKVRRRHHQRDKLVDRAQRRKVTAPYKAIAALLNTTVGNVASQLSRLRKDLAANAALRAHLEAVGDRDD